MKQCTKCKEIKGSQDFKRSKRLKSGLDSWCKVCHYAQRTLNYKQYRVTEKKREVKKYGITYETYLEMLAQQQHKCAICEKPEGYDKRKLHIDHCHVTGKVRQLLCSHCNTVLGKIHESFDMLDKIKAYLIRHRSEG
jgi:hypothetical protein